MKHIIYALFILLNISVLSHAAEEDFYKKDLKISEYTLINKDRLGRNSFEYSYKVKLTNISNKKLKNVRLVLLNKEDLLSNGIRVKQSLLDFGTLEKGETKQSIDTVIISNQRTAILDITKIPLVIRYNAPFTFTDTKGNEIALFLPQLPSGSDSFQLSLSTELLSFSENKNPTNKNLNTFPVITNNFIEISIPEKLSNDIGMVLGYALLSGDPTLNATEYKPFDIEIKYTENPHRLLLLQEGETAWASFNNVAEKHFIQFNATPENNKIVFALIRRN